MHIYKCEPANIQVCEQGQKIVSKLSIKPIVIHGSQYSEYERFIITISPKFLRFIRKNP